LAGRKPHWPFLDRELLKTAQNIIAMKKEISKLERKYWDAMADHDYETVRDLTRFPCLVAGKRGVMSVDEPTYKTPVEKWRRRSSFPHN